jgi:hypothetical protein
MFLVLCKNEASRTGYGYDATRVLYRKKSIFLVYLMLGLIFIIICVLLCKTFRVKCVIKCIGKKQHREKKGISKKKKVDVKK